MSEDEASAVEELLAKKATLCQRLRKGRKAIRSERERGGGRADYFFEVWLSLLTDYEETVDRLRRLGVPEEVIAADELGS